MTLQVDCSTSSTITVPDGFTLDGAGHTITAVDPANGHFVGAVVANAGKTATVKNLVIKASGLANVCDAGANRLRGIMFEGASGAITGNTILGINQGASGCQEGNAIEARYFPTAGSNKGLLPVTISGNKVANYQKTGIVANGSVSATITDNEVIGAGPIGYIAQNGIQVGFGASAKVMRNTVVGNSYTGASTVSGGVLVVGGPGYGGGFVTDTLIQHNTVRNNDVGVYVSQYEADFSAPATRTDIKVMNNVISSDGVHNGYVYQAGISDVGNGDKLISNKISGVGYDPKTLPGSTFDVDADPSFTNRAKIHANKFN